MFSLLVKVKLWRVGTPLFFGGEYCSVRLADLIRTTNAMVVLFRLAEFSLSRVVNRRDFWNR